MSQLKQLTQHVVSHLPKQALIGFDSVMDEPRIVFANRDLGTTEKRQIQLFELHYSAVLSFDRFPYKICDPQFIMSLIVIWLSEQKYCSDLTMPEPTLDLEIIDEETAIFAISVELIDKVNITEDPNGKIPYMGALWRLSEQNKWVADQVNQAVGKHND